MVSRETHVSHMMLRSLCGCRTNKIDDKDTVVVKDYRDTVFIYASHKIIARSLIGILFKTLENRNLKPTGINMVKLNKERLQKSGILSKSGKGSLNEVCVVSLWHGEDIFSRAINAVSSFCKEYAVVAGTDVILTESTKATRKEAELWIDSLPPPLPAVPIVTEEPPEDSDPPDLEEEQTTIIEIEERQESPSPHHLQDSEDVLIIRESSTAETLPVEEKMEHHPQEPETHPPPPAS